MGLIRSTVMVHTITSRVGIRTLDSIRLLCHGCLTMLCCSADEACQRPVTSVEARGCLHKVWNLLDKDEHWNFLDDGKSLGGIISWESRLNSKRRVSMKVQHI